MVQEGRRLLWDHYGEEHVIHERIETLELEGVAESTGNSTTLCYLRESS